MTKINPIFTSGMLSLSHIPDAEHRMIMRKLMAYGFTPTGNKSADTEMLRRIELKQAKMENCVSSKFLTVTRSEQEKIQEDKKEKKAENNPEAQQDTMQGQKLLGEQIMLAIEMKKKAKNI